MIDDGAATAHVDDVVAGATMLNELESTPVVGGCGDSVLAGVA